MKVIQSLQEMQQTILDEKKKGYTVGFVPTMGFLHEGHLSLVERAKKENDLVVMSIFVNPLQFGPNEDFDRYPRNFERDHRLAEQQGVDLLFYPSITAMYPQEMTTEMRAKQRVDVLCGKHRPGHFDGVVTVVMKLFQIVQPTKAYFGMKDAQQVAVIDGLITDYHLPIELIPCPIIREEDGLAKSSRNVNLSEVERKEASHIYQALQRGKELINLGERNSETIKQNLLNYLAENISGEVEYLEILSYPQLREVTEIQNQIIIAVAVKYSTTRLIDNVIITEA
ncbi:pantoate--beta-alanine ligase [Bacillus taeanensis]|uniref:Pantothenate synthetase n=1 Tax=Bacillus taeanensis TaxID=273032 RepID=A0A366XVS8_9BACI|nr:pantoate--beta-alanine ligase [Bacillus taeanensis]RBW70252.1 pantoate--beta-alanine ligase [Bacillus taeanensis]